ncbi:MULTISPECIES: acyltransferase [unclassified Muribaculum]|jgi:hypothetical protein|uniref:acyltransferase n=1 Tax=Muribaculum sp. TaxID=1918611 RepID=UPI000F485213|nr:MULTISPECIES: acyltransferase [unclassified Muribaculum]ROT12163.1 N-acetyltransferase [Muribaculaceae bacterium Isolate-102 (HZI)]TGY02716.1 N-acetyltransferase [Muribaculum sp. NM65_B17]THG43482.1 N-acetyltransferase [Muribaculaceae bacterium]
MIDTYIHPTAVIDNGAIIGNGCHIWHFVHIMEGAVLGNSCNIGQNVMIAGSAIIGNNVKIQNNVSVYDGVICEDDVFLGPSCVFTNVRNPRSKFPRKGKYESTIVHCGATIGANATIVCGVEIGKYAFIGAGAVVTCSVPDYAIVMGVPARCEGWMCQCGHRLEFNKYDVAICPESGHRYCKFKDSVYAL